MNTALEQPARAAGANRIHPVTASVIQGALENIAVEMGYKLMRMSYSSIIRESEDFGAALLDAQGRQLCESKQSTPLQSGPIPGYVRGIMRQTRERGDTFRPGDVIVHNDAYAGASHAPDIGFCVPIFYRDQLVGFAVTTAHHLDIGSLTPGSVGIVDAVDAYAEGLQLKSIKVYDAGKRNEAVWQMLRDNIRVPDLVLGDMEAQIAACRIGAQRFVALIEKWGLDTISAAAEDLFDYSERLMRDAISRIPDGVYRATGQIDGYLDHDDPAHKHQVIAVTITVSGSDMTVDLTGTSPQVPNLPINMPLEGTVDVAIWLVLRSILLDTEVYGDIPQNAGLYRPIKIVAPPGTLANPIFPAPTIARVGPGNIVCDTVMKALAPALPRQISAGIGNLKGVAFTGKDADRHWVHIEIFEGSYGGRYGRNGMDAVDTLYANTRNNPIEDIETHVPLRVERYELREDACAAGKWRGGFSMIKQVRFLTDGGVAVEGEGHAFPPWGFSGGEDGRTAAFLLEASDGRRIEMPSKIPYRAVRAGDTVTAIGAAGGGYGSPLERDPEAVAMEVRDGLISEEAARSRYGVVLNAKREADQAATRRVRAATNGQPRA
jgi:N-methylhydantoinase B